MSFPFPRMAILRTLPAIHPVFHDLHRVDAGPRQDDPPALDSQGMADKCHWSHLTKARSRNTPLMHRQRKWPGDDYVKKCTVGVDHAAISLRYDPRNTLDRSRNRKPKIAKMMNWLFISTQEFPIVQHPCSLNIERTMPIALARRAGRREMTQIFKWCVDAAHKKRTLGSFFDGPGRISDRSCSRGSPTHRTARP